MLLVTGANGKLGRLIVEGSCAARLTPRWPLASAT